MIMTFINTLQRNICIDQPILSDAHVSVFSECPKLAVKRQKAIEYLGDKWILANKHQRLAEPRRHF